MISLDKVLLFALILSIACYVQAKQLVQQSPKFREDEIPQRCVDHEPETAVSCEGVSEDALMPHPEDCHLFYYCVGPQHMPLCRECPADLHFSPTEHVCEMPQDAGCDSFMSLPN